MICVTLGRGRHRTLLEEWSQAADAGAELVELRMDCLRSEINLKRLLSERHTPLVFTVRRGADGGLWRGTEEKRLLLIREAIVSEVDYVDLELDIAKSIPRFGHTKRIVSYHNFRETPADLDTIFDQARGAGPDVVKVATLARSIGDAARLMEAAARSSESVPTVGIAMGPLGVFTRILNRKYGAPFTYAGFNPERVFAPGMLGFDELWRDYGYNRINKDTEVYAVLGDPVAHSLSPAVHNAAFRKLGMNKVYVPLLIPGGTLKASLEALSWLDLKGLSVTIPHKEAIIPLLKQVDGAVERLKACNTVVIKDGVWTGHNTDYHAAMGVLEEAFGGSTRDEVSVLMDKQVVILGAGGVARTIAYGLSRRGAGVALVNRDDERAARVASEVGCRYTSWAARASTPCDILINGTPVGMHPNLDDSPVPPAAFRAGMLVFDTIYHPENTMFLKLARERECRTVTGVDMFVRQAALQFKLFTGKDAPVEVMRDAVSRELGVTRD
ncbi:shikimate dehydrogenase [Tautonia plasticadhaerens]|uniref:Multifunctional fusion protein n=1 Tax=Tautonia plasticadhaerens TaxID=2527974 RepID=A0A518GZ68_9BACT|nr:shikimate dehydrogenase [Tautonia plasticadhaerens]QDV33871.1 Shikimate dehydrogenase [Tautonia plasticadhaerens]